METLWILIRDGQLNEYVFRRRLYSASELTTLLESVGFQILAVWGGLDMRPYNNYAANRLVILAQRPAKITQEGTTDSLLL